MTTFAANLSDYSGERLYIELHDVSASGWAVAFFDDIITYYETAPDVASLSDTVQFYKKVDGVQQEEPTSYNIPWVIAANTADQLIIVDPAQNVTTETKTVDLNTYLSGVSATILGQTVSGVLVDIVKVSDGAQDVTEGFDSFLLETGKTYIVSYKVSDPASGKFAEATFSIVVTSSYQIINGDFETGDLTGWSVEEGTAFADVNVFGDTDCWNGSYNQQGNYHLDGWKGADEPGKGVLRSSVFTLGGTGKISFRLGGGNNAEATYISVKKTDGTEVARFTNTKQEPYNGGAGMGEQYMWVYVFDLTAVASLGDQLYIEIVDNAESGWGLLFVDDIKTYHTEETYAALGMQDTDYFVAENKVPN